MNMKKLVAAISSAVILSSIGVGLAVEKNTRDSSHTLSLELSSEDKEYVKNSINRLNNVIDRNNKRIEYLTKLKNMSKDHIIIPDSEEEYVLTAYTLQEEGYQFGCISSGGYNLLNADLTDRYIAVDPKKIDMHSKVYIEFPEEYRYVKFKGSTFDLNGVYKAVDVGGAIKGNKLDLYVGGFEGYVLDLALDIGRKNVNLYRVEEK